MSDPLRRVTATRYVAPLREGGSLPGLLEADDDGMYVTKFTGAGQGPGALVAEVLAGRACPRSSASTCRSSSSSTFPRSWATPSPTPRSRSCSRRAPA